MLWGSFLAIIFGFFSAHHFFVAYINQEINLTLFCLTIREFEVICIKTMYSVA